jgi:mannose-6-phosphate isomerase-like protein (cupin superfamily)
LAVRNTNYALGPGMLHLAMQPGSVIPANVREGVAEVLFVIEGDFINESTQHLPGTSLHVKTGQQHGPHTTEKGCKVLVLWMTNAAQEANMADFTIPRAAAASSSSG